jgi:pSer/pThr/pTyr-binding forkhead associated (FHA) protein
MHLLLVSLPGPTNNTPVLRALEYGVIILLWLFFMWVVRAVWVEVRPLKRRRRRRDADTDPVVDGKGRKGKQLRLHVIRPDDTYSSNLHARLFRLDGDLWAEDLGSTNGTWINTVRIGERTRLEKGDLLQVGGTVFEVGK